jgi:dipeptidase
MTSFKSICRKSCFVSVLLFTLTLFTVSAQRDYTIDPDGPGYAENCTSIVAGKLATVDGSVITSHTCDGNYRTWLEIVPAKKHEKNDMHPVKWGTLNNETPTDETGVTVKGEIPEAESTFSYLSTAYPCLNEKQLAIGESTIYGREELVNKSGLFLIEELEKIALERCSTARDAVRLIGGLAEKYGYGDLAECITIADKNEVWYFEIAGSGPGKPSALWVAERIPDENVGICANIPRISDVDFKDNDKFMTSADLKENAKKIGYWDGKSPFKFYKIISTGKPYSMREFFVLSSLAPGLNLNMDMDELPFSVKPEKKVSVRDIMAFFRQTYEGTQYDMTRNLTVKVTNKDKDGKEQTDTILSPIANPWMTADMRNLVNELKPGTVTRVRTIAISNCSYSHVIQCRSWLPDEVGAVAWFAFDNPDESPRIPIFSGTTSLPASFKICGQHRYRTDAAMWTFRETNKLATVNWSKGRKIIEASRAAFEEKAFSEMPYLEKRVSELTAEGKNDEAKSLVTEYSNDFAYAAMNKWQEMKAIFWDMFGRGF